MKIETIADIVAEKRNRADEIERNVAEKMKRGEMISDQFAREVVADLRKEADRIEAAWRETCGNAAAMREALVLCYRIIHCAMVTGVINRDDANKAMDAYHAAERAAAERAAAHVWHLSPREIALQKLLGRKGEP